MLAKKIDQPWIDLKAVLPEYKLSRNTLAAKLLEASAQTMQQFTDQGFDGFIQAWKEFDICMDQAVVIEIGDNKVSGIARGIDVQGRLIVDTGQGEKAYASGEVSLRLSP